MQAAQVVLRWRVACVKLSGQFGLILSWAFSIVIKDLIPLN